ncbi:MULTISPECIES: hypothetical protein [Stenotrophomonas]|uniref:hypothetical protein n=1 Tax=Stenotrophomonas TaxID=40323 RepID=UPI00074A5055|nr:MULTISPECIES: hypothetical protein [Stenotrophomonas]KUO98617.1 lana protein [Stenotrophomonas maltophilia]KZC92521.1 lana protein [Stenotrophomonas maltophilia]MBA0289603.1 lana protein [Stenotrophomonas maltophilia]MBA0375015.1 lana protein [Stenotrophomonas maltophilia]MBA0547256.1 lana protein [Stenotrophomonas maltophilia]
MSFVHWIAIMKNQQNRHPGKEPQGRNPQQQQQMDPQQPHKGGKQQEQRSQKHPQQR